MGRAKPDTRGRILEEPCAKATSGLWWFVHSSGGGQRRGQSAGKASHRRWIPAGLRPGRQARPACAWVGASVPGKGPTATARRLAWASAPVPSKRCGGSNTASIFPFAAVGLNLACTGTSPPVQVLAASSPLSRCVLHFDITNSSASQRRRRRPRFDVRCGPGLGPRVLSCVTAHTLSHAHIRCQDIVSFERPRFLLFFTCYFACVGHQEPVVNDT